MVDYNKESKNKEEEQLYLASLLDNVSDVIISTDMKLNIRSWNRAAEIIYGKRAEEVLGKPLIPFLQSEISTEYRMKLMNELKNKGFWKGEVIHKRENGKKKYFLVSVTLLKDKNGKPYGAVAINRDITEQKESEKRFRSLIEFIPIGIGMTNLEGYMITCNNQMLEITGYSESEIQIIHGSAIYVNPEDRKKMINVLKNQGQIQDWEVILKRKDDSLYNGLFSLTEIELEGQKVRLVTLQDITERKKSEDKLKKQKNELSEFTHAMSHDVNNSLTIIDVSAHFLKKEYKSTYVEKIIRQSKYIKELLNHSLTLAEAGLAIEKTDLVELNPLVEGVAGSSIPQNIEFTHDNLPSLVCDREKLKQIFKNLFENAVIHGKPNKIKVKANASEKEILISVVNDGTKIPPAVREKIFKRGFTTRKNSMGLGLAIVKKLIEAHGWQISLLPTTDQTTIQIKITDTV
ncbi:MAG: PAS domain S-box protein [Candidatus Hodarchaeales archaeon]